MLFNLDFANNTIYYHVFSSFSWLLSYTFQFLHLLHNFFYHIAERIIPMAMPSKEGRAEIETNPVNEEVKIRKWPI